MCVRKRSLGDKSVSFPPFQAEGSLHFVFLTGHNILL